MANVEFRIVNVDADSWLRAHQHLPVPIVPSFGTNSIQPYRESVSEQEAH